MRLIEQLYAVLADVAVLTQVAEVECAHNRFAFNHHARIGKLNVATLRQTAYAAFEPIAAALAGIASRSRQRRNGTRDGIDQGECCCRSRQRSRSCDIANVGTRPRVLHVVAKNGYRQARERGSDVKLGYGVE